MKCQHCGKEMTQDPDEPYEEFIKRWESAECEES